MSTFWIVLPWINILTEHWKLHLRVRVVGAPALIQTRASNVAAAASFMPLTPRCGSRHLHPLMGSPPPCPRFDGVLGPYFSWVPLREFPALCVWALDHHSAC